MTDRQTEFPLVDSTPPVGGVEWKELNFWISGFLAVSWELKELLEIRLCQNSQILGHTAWAPEGREGQSQESRRAPHLGAGARRAP